jgi:hypothetical protein
MTTRINITYRKFEKCPLTNESREMVGHAPAIYSTWSGSHHFAFGYNESISGEVLNRINGGEMAGSYKQDGATITWEAE